MPLSVFVRARIEEDEAAARAAGGERFVTYVHDCDWHIEVEGAGHLANFGRESWPMVAEQVAFVARFDPARVLAECESKLAMVDLHDYGHECPGGNQYFYDDEDVEGSYTGPCPTLVALAAPYREHPDYPVYPVTS